MSYNACDIIVNGKDFGLIRFPDFYERTQEWAEQWVALIKNQQ